jgi:predicted chitinase
MDGKTLMAAMTYPDYPPPLPLARYQALAAPCATALRQAHCGTVERVSMFLAQIGAESGSLRWTEELASGDAYEGRADLGNYMPGDGHRFKGRSFIQITGRAHYSNLSIWAHAKGYVPTASYFVDHPAQLAADKYAFLGPVWYWTVARPGLNGLADRRDIHGATVAVNGGTNNLAGRTARWHKCLSLGAALLPASHTTDSGATTTLGTKGSPMYLVLQDASNGYWYGAGPGFWTRITNGAVLKEALGSRLCANAADIHKKRHAGYRLEHARIVARKSFYLGG